MRSRFLGYVIALTVGVGLSGSAWAQKNRNKKAEADDTTIEKQSEWEKKVMGEDAAKKNEMKKIAEAKRLADEAAKHPQPVAAPKPKDPNKEGVRAKQEAAIGLPIESDNEPAKVARKNNAANKKAEPSSSSNDALGALVASSLAEDRSAEAAAKSKGNRTKGGAGRGKGKAAASGTSSLDQMFAAGK
jgi:hypothetical protein